MLQRNTCLFHAVLAEVSLSRVLDLNMGIPHRTLRLESVGLYPHYEVVTPPPPHPARLLHPQTSSPKLQHPQGPGTTIQLEMKHLVLISNTAQEEQDVAHA